jgi:zinc protease
MRRACSALLATIVALAPLAAGAAPGVTAIDLGGVPGYIRPDAGALLAGMQLFVRAGLDRQTPAQNGLASLVAESLLRVRVDGTPLADAVAARGGSLSAAVSGQYVRFHLEGRPEVVATAATLVAGVLAHPAFDPATVGAARAALVERLADAETDPRAVGVQMLRGSYYRDGPGMPPLGTREGLAALREDDVRSFFARWYLRGGALVAVVGAPSEGVQAAARRVAAALAPGAAPAAVVATRPFGAQPKRIVTHREGSGSYVVLGFAAPALGDRDFPAVLVMKALLGDLFESSGVTSQPAVFRPAGTIYAYDTAPAQLALWLNGRLVDPGVGLAAVDAVLKSAAAKPLGVAALRRYRDTARGAWALEYLSLDERAWSVGNAAVHGLDPAAADAVAPAIALVTAADVQRVAKRYFARFDVALILPRQGSGG